MVPPKVRDSSGPVSAVFNEFKDAPKSADLKGLRKRAVFKGHKDARTGAGFEWLRKRGIQVVQ